MGTMGRAYREVIGLTGPLLPVVSFLGRLPTATIQFGSVLLVARTRGSLTAAGLTCGAPALGQVACGPLVGRLADRRGQRTVVLVFSLVNTLAITALVAGAPGGLFTPLLAVLGATAGATVPQIGPRARLIALARRADAPDTTVATALSSRAPWTRSPSSSAPPWSASPRSWPTRPTRWAPPRCRWPCAEPASHCIRRRRERPPPQPRHPPPPPDPVSPVPSTPYAPPSPSRVAMFGACQAGITALTERLGQPDQAGLVCAAMGVMSAVAGLSMAAVPARVPLATRWRTATAAAFALSLPLLWTDGLVAL
ncbi:hypothetical protein QF037_002450 [Streptomyces canus]|uniref:MFS transporter n=1 Tax=Streptomyces canus TaxID=58343 RepID=UPI00278350E7|nr:MFS transporter [Streptomyces canus]MDQ0598105.1 hypothetical protein [Streptomyces canus]